VCSFSHRQRRIFYTEADMHWTTLVQRCRSTNSLLADEIAAEFQRLERELEMTRGLLKKATDPNPFHEPRKRFSTSQD